MHYLIMTTCKMHHTTTAVSFAATCYLLLLPLPSRRCHRRHLRFRCRRRCHRRIRHYRRRFYLIVVCTRLPPSPRPPPPPARSRNCNRQRDDIPTAIIAAIIVALHRPTIALVACRCRPPLPSCGIVRRPRRRSRFCRGSEGTAASPRLSPSPRRRGAGEDPTPCRCWLRTNNNASRRPPPPLVMSSTTRPPPPLSPCPRLPPPALIAPSKACSCNCQLDDIPATIVVAFVDTTSSSPPHDNLHPCEEHCRGASAGARDVFSDGGHDERLAPPTPAPCHTHPPSTC
jgi:hypothetical protein